MNTHSNKVAPTPGEKHLSVRVPVALADRFVEMAKAEDRSISAEIRRALERHVREYEKAAA